MRPIDPVRNIQHGWKIRTVPTTLEVFGNLKGEKKKKTLSLVCYLPMQLGRNRVAQQKEHMIGF